MSLGSRTQRKPGGPFPPVILFQPSRACPSNSSPKSVRGLLLGFCPGESPCLLEWPLISCCPDSCWCEASPIATAVCPESHATFKVEKLVPLKLLVECLLRHAWHLNETFHPSECGSGEGGDTGDKEHGRRRETEASLRILDGCLPVQALGALSHAAVVDFFPLEHALYGGHITQPRGDGIGVPRGTL